MTPILGNAQRVLAILHRENSSTGRVGCLLRAAGFVVEERRPCCGDPLPHPSSYAGVAVFGGPMSVNDPLPFLAKEAELIERTCREGVPLLGICLGAQLLAKVLGARVDTHPEGAVEAGYYVLRATDAGRALCGAPMPDHVYHWHEEGCDLPVGADLLAESDGFPIQAFRHGAAVALQFHPEVTYKMMCRWTTYGHERLAAPGDKSPREHLDGWYQHDGAVDRWTRALLTSMFFPGRQSLAVTARALPTNQRGGHVVECGAAW